MAKRTPPADQPSAEHKPVGGLDVATVAPWVLFWGWVALDSALAYRKSQAALEQAAEAEAAVEHHEAPPAEEPRLRRWMMGAAPITLDGLRAVQRRTRTAMIGAPFMALLGPLVLGKLLRRRKP